MQNIQHVVIVGGGTAGWMSAAALSKVLGALVRITLIESDQIGTVGVGEATIPSIRLFNNLLGLDENEFLRKTKGSIKLGIEFSNWANEGDRYLHAFGNLGLDLGMAKFYQYWLKRKLAGDDSSLWDYSFNAQAAKRTNFQPVEQIEGTPLAGLSYAFHFDAGLYATYLRDFSEAKSVQRIEGKVEHVIQDDRGHISSLVLEDGQQIDGDLFIDCSGFKGLLIEQTLKAGYNDWRQYLPCDSALAVPCESSAEHLPYTKAIAHGAGWQWRIPLQHRIGNGHVFCSDYMSRDAAERVLLNNLDGKPLSDPKLITFTTGMRKKAWVNNCVAIGLSGGFMEPLESTSIHLIQSGISRLLTLFPDQEFSQRDIDEFNKQTEFEFVSIRDFLILHYKATQRDDTDFWRMCQAMPIPDSLAERMELFKTHGRIFRNNDELFTDVGWAQVLIGQGVMPSKYHPIADSISDGQVEKFLADLKQIYAREAAKLPKHASYLARLST